MSHQGPLLSLILCSRNDAYMGNSRWRLETSLNYVGERVHALGRSADVEVIVTDWGSEVPLGNVVRLGPAASRIVSFLTVSPDLASALQRDSPFPEVLALNAAARRARGEYIGRIDQDTLVGAGFLRWLFAEVDRPRRSGASDVALERSLLFANRRSIPYRLAAACPRPWTVEKFVALAGRRLRIETGRVFYRIDVGIWLLHRRLWHDCGGYDERMIYMNDMEIEMANRLMSKYPMIDLGRLVDYDFFHLDHYHPRGSRSSSTHRKVNGDAAASRGYQPNGDGWGLADFPLVLAPSSRPAGSAAVRSMIVEAPLFALRVGYTAIRVAFDRAAYPFIPTWRRRARLAWAAVRGQSLVRWPALLRKIWVERPSARAQ